MQQNSSEQSIVITGFECITAAGHNLETTWNAINQGQSGIDKITLWDITEWEYQIGAEIKDYKPRKMVDDRKLLKVIVKHDVLGLYAVKQALGQSGLRNYQVELSDPTSFNDRTGIYVGSPGIMFNQQYEFLPLFTKAKRDMKKFGEALFETVHPMWLLRMLSNNVLAYTAIQYGFKGANQNVVNHACAGSQALIEATHALRNGIVDRAVVIGYGAGLEPQTQLYYGKVGLLSNQMLRPFDEQRDGTVLGEGAGAIILETKKAAQERKATIYGEILGGATTSEARGIFTIRDDGDGLIRAISNTVARANLRQEDIGMVCAHANGTTNSDAIEAASITKSFTKNPTIPVTGFKWALGHTLAAGGVIDSILTLMSLNNKSIPGIATLEKQAGDCQAINVSNDIQTPLSSIGLVITRGFSGISSCVLLKGSE